MSVSTIAFLVLIAACAPATMRTATAQAAHHQLPPRRPIAAPAEGITQGGGVQFGHRAIAIDDLDGDGERDWAVSAPLALRGSHELGCVLLLSSRSHRVLARTDGARSRGFFGWNLDSAVDLDGDGHSELLCAELGWGWPRSTDTTLYLLSGRDATCVERIPACAACIGCELDFVPGDEPRWLVQSCFVQQVASIGGRSGKREAELNLPFLRNITGLRDQDNRLTNRFVGQLEGHGGTCVMFSFDEPMKRTTLDVPFALEGDPLNGMLTASCMCVDGQSLTLVGIPAWNDFSGAVFVFSSDTGRLQRKLDVLEGALNTRNFTSELGYALLAVPDLDGDGTPDVVVSAPEFGLANGIVIAWSPATGKRIWEATGEVFGNVGTSLDLLEDVDGDGVRDLLVGGGDHGLSNGVWKRNGTVRVLSGANGQLLDIVKEAEYPELRGSGDAARATK